MSDDDKQTIFGFPVASIGFVDKEREAEITRLRSELAAMTARKDCWRRVAKMYRRELIEYVIEKQNENEVNAMYSTPDEVMKRNFIGWFSRRRREARNG